MKNKNSKKPLAYYIFIYLAVIYLFTYLYFRNTEFELPDGRTFIIDFFLLGVIFVGVFLVSLSIYLYGLYLKTSQKNKKIEAYKKTKYYLDTNFDFDKVNTNSGLQFEFLVYNELALNFPNSRLLTNILIPKKNSINDYSEIDIIFLHTTGFYVLELKNYNAFIYGNLTDERWTAGYKNEERRTPMEFQNPLLQNKKHIEVLQEHINEDFINQVIFSDNAVVDSSIESVTTLNTFIEKVKASENIYNVHELDELSNKIKKINVYDKIQNHIERIKYNKIKHK